ncbi:hypothetical protein HDU98_003083 [Podochytrium sp. JEL0797]|nr:hypothetical protein HDU98_003083 [Podochytrium sp. JEL0797]
MDNQPPATNEGRSSSSFGAKLKKFFSLDRGKKTKEGEGGQQESQGVSTAGGGEVSSKAHEDAAESAGTASNEAQVNSIEETVKNLETAADERSHLAEEIEAILNDAALSA